MYEIEITQATAKAGQLAHAMTSAYAEAETLSGDARAAKMSEGQDYALKLTEANVDLQKHVANKESYDKANEIAARLLTPAGKAPAKGPEPEAAGAWTSERIKGAHATAASAYLKAGRGECDAAYREALAASGLPKDIRASLTGTNPGDAARAGILLPTIWGQYNDPGTIGVVMRDLITVQPTDSKMVIPSSTRMEPSDDDWTRASYKVSSGSERTIPFRGVDIELNPFNPGPVPIDAETLYNKYANVESIVMTELYRLAETAYEKALTTGNGANKPEGFLANAGTTGAIATVSSLDPAGTGFSWNGIMKLLGSIPENWASNLTAVCRRLTFFNDILTVVDPAGRYVFQLANEAAPNTILGVPVRFNQFMEAPAASAKALAIGNWKACMTMTENPAASRLMRFDDSNFAPGAGFALTALVGGKVVQPEAARIQVCSAS